jgi:hypothetical protein
MADNENRVLPKATRGKTRTEHRSKSRTFMEEDAPIIAENLKELVVPELLNIAFDAVKELAGALIFRDYARDDRPSYSGSRRSSGYKQDYGRYYDRGRRYGGSSEPRTRQGSLRNRYEVDEVIFESRDDADAVLDIISQEMQDYGRVTVGAYYSACDISPRGGDFNYGWYDIRNARVEHRRGNWVIVMPKCVPMDN